MLITLNNFLIVSDQFFDRGVLSSETKMEVVVALQLFTHLTHYLEPYLQATPLMKTHVRNAVMLHRNPQKENLRNVPSAGM